MVSPNKGRLFGIRKQRRETGIQWRKAIKEPMKLLKIWGTSEATAFKAQEIRHSFRGKAKDGKLPWNLVGTVWRGRWEHLKGSFPEACRRGKRASTSNRKDLELRNQKEKMDQGKKNVGC